jgi:hypothetical protein
LICAYSDNIKSLKAYVHPEIIVTKSCQEKPGKFCINSMIRSVLEYGCVVFGELPSLTSDKLERMQYRAGVAVSGAIRNSSYEKIP